MCGIAGIFYHDGREADLSLLKAMTDTLMHRGPDSEGHQILAHEGLGHRRLSIIDLEGAAQPMCNEDQSVWITYNGEVYNFGGLRSQLLQKGHIFQTNCDTEAIVHLYEEHGDEVPTLLRGMFAFGIWDSKKRKLLLARDRIGQKPLYWFEDPEGIYFASEMKALLKLPNFQRSIRLQALDQYLTYQSVPGTGTIFEGVHRLAPGHILTWEPNQKAKTHCYWKPDWTQKTTMSYREAEIELRDRIVDATRARMISDVPLGAFLSGGVDSSAIVSAMSEVTNAPVKTFSIGFKEQDFTETQFARQIAEKFKTDHMEFVVEPDAMSILPKLVYHYDQPYADSSALPTYYLSKMTREHVTVALNGDGGDEFWGGYDRYRAALYMKLYSNMTTSGSRGFFDNIASRIPEGAANKSIARKIRRFAHASRNGTENFNTSIFSFFDKELRHRIYSDQFAEKIRPYEAEEYMLSLLLEDSQSPNSLGIIDRTLRTDTLMYLPDTLLVKVDVASMAASLEARSPLLDTKVMEFGASLPAKWKVGFFRSKSILKRAHHNILPYNILYRPKMGFGVPLSHWFRGDLHDYLKDILLDKQSIDRGYFQREKIEDLINEHKAGIRNNANRLWALLTMELWHREFMDG